jgi:hypothetical protein
LVEAIEESKRENSRARSLASPGWDRRGGVMGAGAQHACEWSDDFSLSTFWVQDFLLILDIFACMEKIVLAYFGEQLFLH